MISIIIPAYNEDSVIVKVITDIKNVMSLNKLPCEIIVVDDGSDDNTNKEITKSGLQIKLLTHEKNKGYGASLKTAIENASCSVIAIIDSDGTYPPDKIPELFNFMIKGDYHMVVGARTGKVVNIPFSRIPAKWILKKIANYLSGQKIPDLNSGLRIMKKDVVKKFIKILPDGFSFTTTITLALLTNNYKVGYLPINYFKRTGKSKIRPFHDTLNFIQLIIRTVLYFNPLKIFIPLSIFLIIFAFLLLAGSWFFFGKAMDVSFGVVLMTAVTVMAIGMLADFIDKRLP